MARKAAMARVFPVHTQPIRDDPCLDSPLQSNEMNEECGDRISELQEVELVIPQPPIIVTIRNSVNFSKRVD
jgi:hypothetical protein